MEHDNKLAVPMAIVIAGALVAGAIFYSNKTAPAPVNPQRAPQAQVQDKINFAPITSADHIRGNPAAPIIIVEYSDLECPFCKVFHQTLTRIMDEYGKNGQVAVVYRHFPLDIHPKAYNEAIASECAASVGGNAKFWEFVDGVYAVTPSNNGLDPAQLPIIAKNIGLDTAAFNTCMTQQATKAKVDTDMKSGGEAGVQGTPFSIVVTKSGVQTTINGAQPYSYVKSVIDTILAEVK